MKICMKCKITRAFFGLQFGKALFCKKCSPSSEYINVYSKMCKCNKRPSFGLSTDKRPSCCSKCKTNDMINLINKHRRCRCNKQANFGLLTDKRPSCCSKCKTNDMIDLINKKLCKCNVLPSFGLSTDKRPSCCSKCKTNDMIDLINKKRMCQCNVRPSFGKPSDKQPSCCSKCKTNDMIDLINKHRRCRCNKQASFGLLTDKRPSCCSKCKTNDMINLINKHRRCPCNKHASFGISTDKRPSCCSKCKTNDMINIVGTKCICGVEPSFGLDSDKTRICCKNCKTSDMINLKNKKCKCGKAKASFGYPEDKIELCCYVCKLDGMINIYSKKCKSNENGIYCEMTANKSYDNYCTHCFKNIFPNDPRTLNTHLKSKELKVVSYISNIYNDFYHDKPLYINLSGGCCTSKRRIDLRKLIGNTLLCIEIDENQHKSYDDVDEENRYNDLFIDCSCKYLFIRYNPDSYKQDKRKLNPPFDKRMEELVNQINIHTQRIEKEENTELVEIHHLYFDC
jgi:hypothetical protein